MWQVVPYQDGYVVESGKFGVLGALCSQGTTRVVYTTERDYADTICDALNSHHIVQHDLDISGLS